MGESLVYGIKIALAVAGTMLFMSGILAIVSLITSLITSGIIGEILGLFSVYLPFDPALFFGGIDIALSAIITFLVARKIWDLTGATYKMA